MSTSSLDPGAAHARERLLELLTARGAMVVADTAIGGDGWRGEFLTARPRDFAVHIHKPLGSAWFTLGTIVRASPPESVAGIEALLDLVSDYDVAVYWNAVERSHVVLSLRLFHSSLNSDDLALALDMLADCREAVAALIGRGS